MSGGESLEHSQRIASSSDTRWLDARHERGGQASIERISPMGLLPCLRRGSDRWWLPCSLQASEVLGELLLRSGTGSIEPALRRRVHRAILTDPPLMIYCALHWTDDCVSPMQLADWLADRALPRLASGDAYLGEPQITPAIARTWNRLRDHFRTRPHEQWLDDAGLWLEATGPRVPDGWRDEWPTLIPDEDLPAEVDASKPPGEPSKSSHMLQQLARMVQRQRSLESSFDERLHRNKLGSLKQLAYGLSHEINNPLANISTRAQQLQRGEEDDSRAATLQRIVDQVYRAHEMIADLMFYANPPAAEISTVNPAKVLLTAVESYRGQAERQSIHLELNVPATAYLVKADERMLGEAIGVLIRNSVEAIGCQGSIVVSLEADSDKILMIVSDSGPGLSEDARAHAFDPYYSGREAGRGLGLGLCRAYRIVKLHHGHISLSTAPVGCVATIELRRAEDL